MAYYTLQAVYKEVILYCYELNKNGMLLSSIPTLTICSNAHKVYDNQHEIYVCIKKKAGNLDQKFLKR